MKTLYVLYDFECGFCRRIKNRFAMESAFIELKFMASLSDEAHALFPELCREAQELIVVDDEGGVYRDTDAYIMVLYALKPYREWSLRFAGPMLRPLVKNLFHAIAKNRQTISRIFQWKSDHDIAEELDAHQPITCQGGLPQQQAFRLFGQHGAGE
jgi:predicted DCC family thiol-disulfide oxidoreductase YuxK